LHNTCVAIFTSTKYGIPSTSWLSSNKREKRRKRQNGSERYKENSEQCLKLVIMPQFVVVDGDEVDDLVADGGINKKTAEARARIVGYVEKVCS
jgi:hypothetical protein